MFETIVALATAPIKSALSIVRLSGDDVLDVVSKCCSKDLRDIKERTILYASIVDKGEKVDDVVLLVYKGPKSFTGEDSVEIICHGSPLIAKQIVEVKFFTMTTTESPSKLWMKESAKKVSNICLSCSLSSMIFNVCSHIRAISDTELFITVTYFVSTIIK